jgi:hypothetical protein
MGPLFEEALINQLIDQLIITINYPNYDYYQLLIILKGSVRTESQCCKRSYISTLKC